jgi:hypothetical protein
MRKITSVLRVDKPGFTVKKLSRRSLKKRSESLSRYVDEQPYNGLISENVWKKILGERRDTAEQTATANGLE